MNNQFKESVHQEFERFMRDEMNDSERKSYVRSKRYETMIKRFSEILIEKGIKHFQDILFRMSRHFWMVSEQ